MSERLHYFDGLRGVAALVVVVGHFLSAFIPAMVFGSQEPEMALANQIAGTPLYVLYSGTFAVFIFFVMSGFVFARALDRSDRGILENLIRRYLRFALPVLASILVAWVLIGLLPDANQRVGEILDVEWFARQYAYGAHDIERVLREGLYRNFVAGGSYYNLALWTMRVELLGSIALIILYCALQPKYRMLLLFFSIVYLLGFTDRGWWQNLAAIAVGAVFWEGSKLNWKVPYAHFLGAVFVLAGLYLGGLPRVGVRPDSPLRPVMDVLRELEFGNAYFLIMTAAASCLVLGIALWPRAQKLLSGPIGRKLGDLSFPVYLLHFPIVGTVGAWVFVTLNGFGVSTPIAITVSFACYLLLVLGLSELFHRYVEIPTLSLIRLLSRHWPSDVQIAALFRSLGDRFRNVFIVLVK